MTSPVQDDAAQPLSAEPPLPTLDLARRVLLLPDGATLPLRGRDIPFRLLEALIRRRGELVTKRELFEWAWNSRYLGKAHDGRLHFHIGRLRALLGHPARENPWLRTHRDGYQLAGPFRLRGGAASCARAVPAIRLDGESLREWLEETGELTNRDLATRFGLSRSAALRALRAWTRTGVLTRRGGGRAARYALAAA